VCPATLFQAGCEAESNDCEETPLAGDPTASFIVCDSVLKRDPGFWVSSGSDTADAATIDAANRAAVDTGCDAGSIAYTVWPETPCMAARYGDWLAAAKFCKCATESNNVGAIGRL